VLRRLVHVVSVKEEGCKMQKVVILGAGPFSKEVYWCFHDAVVTL
jgi:hypothetical protein